MAEFLIEALVANNQMCGSKTSGTLFLLFQLLTGAGKFSLFEQVSRDLNRHSEAASWLILASNGIPGSSDDSPAASTPVQKSTM